MSIDPYPQNNKDYMIYRDIIKFFEREVKND